MNRVFTWLNLFGVLGLTLLCAAQWRANRTLNLDYNRLELTRLSQSQKINEQADRIEGLGADLSGLRNQLQLTSTALGEANDRQRAANLQIEQLTHERERLKDAITGWSEAMTSRDETIQLANQRISSLNQELKNVIEQFNAHIATYNTLVETHNALRSTSQQTTPTASP